MLARLQSAAPQYGMYQMSNQQVISYNLYFHGHFLHNKLIRSILTFYVPMLAETYSTFNTRFSNLHPTSLIPSNQFYLHRNLIFIRIKIMMSYNNVVRPLQNTSHCPHVSRHYQFLSMFLLYILV